MSNSPFSPTLVFVIAAITVVIGLVTTSWGVVLIGVAVAAVMGLVVALTRNSPHV